MVDEQEIFISNLKDEYLDFGEILPSEYQKFVIYCLEYSIIEKIESRSDQYKILIGFIIKTEAENGAFSCIFKPDDILDVSNGKFLGYHLIRYRTQFRTLAP